jgi:hypothetical protein
VVVPLPPVMVPAPPPPPVILVPEIIVVPIQVDVAALVERQGTFAPELPWHRLRQAREVRVEIVAPPPAFDALDTGLRATLRQHGVEPAQVTRRPSRDGTVSLGFWIWR